MKFNFLIYNLTNYALSSVGAMALYNAFWVGCVKYRKRPFSIPRQTNPDRSKPNSACTTDNVIEVIRYAKVGHVFSYGSVYRPPNFRLFLLWTFGRALSPHRALYPHISYPHWRGLDQGCAFLRSHWHIRILLTCSWLNLIQLILWPKTFDSLSLIYRVSVCFFLFWY